MSTARKTGTKSPEIRQHAEGQPMDASQGAATDSSWKSIYKVGGWTALLLVLVALLDIVATFLPGASTGAENLYTTFTVFDWFALYQSNWLEGLRLLGFLNIVHNFLLIPTFIALYLAHRQANAAYAALATILFIMGGAIYIANNAAIPIFVLSGKYAAATTDAQRSLLAAAGEAILTRGADFTPGAFIGIISTGLAGLAISLVMLRGKVFGKAVAYAGILGFTTLAIFTIWVTFVPSLYTVALIFGSVGGLSVITWYILVARRLFQLSNE